MRQRGEQPVTYHTGIDSRGLATDVIVAGDAGRVKMLADLLLSRIEHSDDHRGLPWFTGPTKKYGRPLTIATHQMGAGTGEITLVEMIAAQQLDFETLTRRNEVPPINITRLGTCGLLLQPEEHQLGVPFILEKAVGMDCMASFYRLDPALRDLEWERHFRDELTTAYTQAGALEMMPPIYSVLFDAVLNSALNDAAAASKLQIGFGKGVGAPGFFAPQGRDPIVPNALVPDLHLVYKRAGAGVIEMECGFIGLLGRGISNRTGCVLIPVAGRISHQTAGSQQVDIDASMAAAGELILDAYQQLAS